MLPTHAGSADRDSENSKRQCRSKSSRAKTAKCTISGRHSGTGSPGDFVKNQRMHASAGAALLSLSLKEASSIMCYLTHISKDDLENCQKGMQM